VTGVTFMLVCGLVGGVRGAFPNSWNCGKVVQLRISPSALREV
jgi:hypothetical protein